MRCTPFRTIFLVVFSCIGAYGQGPVISSTYLTTISVGRQQLKVYPDTQNWATDNASYPNRWLFEVQPSLRPELDRDGSILIKEQEEERHRHPIPGGFEYVITTRLGLVVRVSDEETMDDAAQAVTDYFKDRGYNFDARQISTIPIKQVTVDLADLSSSSSCALKNKDIPVSSADTSFLIWVDCQDKKQGQWPDVKKADSAVQQFKAHLEFLNATVTVTYDAKLANVSVVTFKAKDLKNTSLYAKLAGDGGETFVSRDDLRQLSMDAGKDIYIDYRGQRPQGAIVDEFVKKILDFATTVSVDSSTFTKEMLAQTYNPKDVDPNEINKTFDQNIDKSSSEDQVKLSGGGNVGILGGLFSAGGNMSGEYFKKAMSDKEVTVEFNGTKWIAKKVDIKRINISKFAQSFGGSVTDVSVDAAAPYAVDKRQLRFEPLPPVPPAKQSQMGTKRILVPAAYQPALLDDNPMSELSVPQKRGDQAQQVGCCCLLKDAGPPPVWDCTGSTDGTTGTEKQCAQDADDAGKVKYKWHAGKCTDKD